MCYHISLDFDKKKLEGRFKKKLANNEEFMGRNQVNGFSKPIIPIILSASSNCIDFGEWGFGANDGVTKMDNGKTMNSILNARGETIFTNKLFKNFCNNRCLIPVSGFYEWKLEGNRKIPYLVTLKDQKIFCLGGIFKEVEENGESFKRVAIITIEANEIMRQIHNTKMRMPLVFDDKNENKWIDEDLSKDNVSNLMQAIDTNKMFAMETIYHKKIIETNEDKIRGQQLKIF